MKLSQTAQFKRDIRKQIKRGKDPNKLTQVVGRLLKNEVLPETYKDHPLRGKWVGRRDCHIEPDWVLIYRKNDSEIRLERTGSHRDLF
ncbi:MAG: type II toxin-antitoxin system YafQ family toxin [Okeania sp. SIO3H1]|nr:type II toxin-antitoxin system YafQ family toxin [Okeania sp. SIO3H1]